jgi:hypothetical protein
MLEVTMTGDEVVRGRTRSGVAITDSLIDRQVEAAEAGLELARMHPVRGRPRIGSAPAKAFPVRLDPELRRSLDERAAQEDRPASEVVRDALRRYLSAS